MLKRPCKKKLEYNVPRPGKDQQLAALDEVAEIFTGITL